MFDISPAENELGAVAKCRGNAFRLRCNDAELDSPLRIYLRIFSPSLVGRRWLEVVFDPLGGTGGGIAYNIEANI